MERGSLACICEEESLETVCQFLLRCGQYINTRVILVCEVREVFGIKSDALVDDRLLLPWWRFTKEVQ